MICTGRDGYACAPATRNDAGSAAAPAARCRNCLRWGSFTTPSQNIFAEAGYQYVARIASCPRFLEDAGAYGFFRGGAAVPAMKIENATLRALLESEVPR